MSALTVYATDSTEETYTTDLVRYNDVFQNVRSSRVSCNTTKTESFRYDAAGVEQKVTLMKYEMSTIAFPTPK
jgi:hypothetical protein